MTFGRTAGLHYFEFGHSLLSCTYLNHFLMNILFQSLSAIFKPHYHDFHVHVHVCVFSILSCSCCYAFEKPERQKASLKNSSCESVLKLEMGDSKLDFQSLIVLFQKISIPPRPHGRLFLFEPLPPLWKFQLSIILSIKKLLFRNPPLPLGNSVNLPWGIGNEYFLEPAILKSIVIEF